VTDGSAASGDLGPEPGLDRIPMVVLGGWLGSGKTTLLNRLLRASGGERFAVVVNDVGAVNLDAELVAARDGATVELTNGCVCCSIGDSLALTLRDLVLSDRPPDRLVIEASGVAEPDRVAAYGDRRRIRLDGVVVAVDGTRAGSGSRLEPASRPGQYQPTRPRSHGWTPGGGPAGPYPGNR